MQECESCGYGGYGQKMSMDVTQTWKYLQEYGFVKTARPVWKGYEGGTYYRTQEVHKIHIHRHSKWTGWIGTKTVIIRGEGKEPLFAEMGIHCDQSGFSSPSSWLNTLVDMHGLANTVKAWIIYNVEAHKETISEKRLREQNNRLSDFMKVNRQRSLDAVLAIG